MMYRILLTCVLNSFCHSRSSSPAGFRKGVIMLCPMYALSPIQSRGLPIRRTSDSSMQYESWRLPLTGSEIHASVPESVQATCTFIPVVLCFPEYSSGCDAHDQQGSRVPSMMYCVLPSRSSAVGT